MLSVECPDEMRYVWDDYIEIRRGAGDGPLTYATVKTWMELMDKTRAPHEIEAYLTVDCSYRAGLYREEGK